MTFLKLNWNLPGANELKTRNAFADNHYGFSYSTHWGLQKTAKIMQRAFSNAVSWMKIIIFIFNFQWKVCSWGSNWQLIIRWLLGIQQATSHYLNQFDRDACCGTKLQQVNNKHTIIIINKLMHQISHEKSWLMNIHILNGTMKQSGIKIRKFPLMVFALMRSLMWMSFNWLMTSDSRMVHLYAVGGAD